MRRRIYTALGLVVILLLTGCTVSVSPRYGNLRGFVGVRRNLNIASVEGLSEEISLEDIVISSAALDTELFYPLVGARVSISGERDEWRTNGDGMFFAYDLPVGYKRITISHQALREDLIKEVRIKEDPDTMDFIGGVGYYIVIGIENYPSIDVENAPGAENDAVSVADVFHRYTKLPGYGVTLLGDQAKKVDIEHEIRNASRWAASEDYLVIYFAGHMGSDYLSPYDDDGRFYSTAITDSDLEGWLREFPGYVTVILDGSDSATFADGREPLIRPQALQKPKYTVITSAGEGQKAHVVEGGHGLFTHYLIAGLSTPEERLESDKNGDGTITAQEIFDYIKAGIQKHVGGAQVPELHVGSSENTVILRY